MRLQREKLISSMGLNSYSHTKNHKLPSETAKLALPSRESPSKGDEDDEEEEEDADGNGQMKMVDDPLLPLGLLVPDGVTIAPVIATPDHDRDIAIVNNFFSNQLWKPEYIGTYS